MSCLIRLTTDCFVSLASFVHNQLINFGVKEKNLIFLPNIIEYEQWKVKTNYSILSPFRMVYVAYVLPNKCQDFIVDVLFMLANRYNVVVDCYGDLTNSEYVDSIQEKVKRYSLEGNLNLLGCIDNSLLKNILKSYDAYICPSKMEMSPVNILEAQASGLPVIASNVGGISDLIRDHEDGLLFEWNDVEDAADKIIKLIKDEELRLKLGETARKRVSESYTAQIAGRKLFDKIKNYC
jgi:glycosyltransferase involved in cell wall biosynthesis